MSKLQEFAQRVQTRTAKGIDIALILELIFEIIERCNPKPNAKVTAMQQLALNSIIRTSLGLRDRDSVVALRTAFLEECAGTSEGELEVLIQEAQETLQPNMPFPM